jgi:hypothetical protein
VINAKLHAGDLPCCLRTSAGNTLRDQGPLSISVMSMDWIGYKNRFKSNPKIKLGFLTGYVTG